MKPIHSPIGASSMHRWSKCPGSVKLSEGIPSSTSKYAEEGTLAHTVAAKALDENLWIDGIDEEMKSHVLVYTSCVWEDWKKAHRVPESLMFVEHGFDLSKLHPNLYGTADAIIYDAPLKTLRVYDLKYGKGITVEVTDNEQLMYYGLGALLAPELSGKEINEIELIIVQPRAPHDDGQIRRWKFSSIDLLDFTADLIEAAKRTLEENAAIVPGDHCRFCPAAAICPELNKKAQILAKQEFEVIVKNSLSVPKYDPIKLATTLEWLPSLKAFIESVNEFAYNEAVQGRCPPGYKLVEKRATRKWINDVETENFLLNIDSVQKDQIYEIKLKSPAQIEKMLPKEKQIKMDELTIKASSGVVLVHESDKRPQVKNDAKSEFALIDIFS